MRQIRVLGPVDVVDGETGLADGGPIQRRMLAILVSALPRSVPISTLVSELWDAETQPENPIATIRTYVTRLRQTLGAEGIITSTGAYALGDVETDAARFEDLVERARRLSGSPTSSDLWRQALDLWRGPAYGDLADLESVRPEAVRLDELRAEATEAWIDARLADGDGRELTAAVETAVKQFPLREGFRAQQMTVLARAGRQADALRAFQDFRSELTDIGLQPSERLVDLDLQVASGEVPQSGARRTLRGYQLGGRLGEGAFAQVWAATQASIGREVAIKQIRASLADQPEFIRQFEAEAQLIARLEHPHIVPLYDYWREPGSAYLVMRYLDGGSLANALGDETLGLDVVAKMSIQVADALDTAHRAGVIHRDVKPANILLDRSANAYLADFGIAVEEAERLDPEAWLSHGSPAYAPPEQLERREVGPTADIYALGVTVYEALTGRLPFPAETTMAGLLNRQLNDPIPLVRASRPETPTAVDAVLQRATAKSPAERYQTATAFAADLATAAGLEGNEALITYEDRNPYKGLSAFTEADASDFTGRDRLVGQLIEVLTSNRAVAVVGPSGSGKSSVVRAGLLPALQQGSVSGSDRWFTTTMIPGAEPFTDLEAALLRVAVDPPPDLQRRLRDDRTGLSRVVRRIVPNEQRLLLVIDQFEELFTLSESAQAISFLDSLVEALGSEHQQLQLVVTLRADFYDRPLRHDRFARLIEQATVSVPPLAPDELERAITQPATAVGARFEPGLVAQITADVADQPGSLPLLQYTLTELFDERRDHTITHASYQELQGIGGSIGRRAEDLYGRSTTHEQEATRRSFTRLVTLGEGSEDTRRRVVRSELGGDETVETVLEKYGDARLLAFDRDPTTREQTVEVAHEALIRHWPRFRRWLDDDRDGLRVLRHLTEAADTWDVRDRDDSELYRGGRLEAATDWACEHRESLTELETRFLQVSSEQQAAEQATERRQLTRLRRLLGAVAIVAALALIAGTIAFVQGDRANAEARSAQARGLAAQATALAPTEIDTALILAANAATLESSTATEQGLLTVLNEARFLEATMPLPGDAKVLSARVTPSAMVTYSEDGLIRGYEPSSLDALGPPISVGEGLNPEKLDLSDEGNIFSFLTNDGFMVGNVATGDILLEGIAASTPGDLGALLSARGTYLLVSASGPDSLVEVYRTDDGVLLGTVPIGGTQASSAGVPQISANEDLIYTAGENAETPTSTIGAYALPSLEPVRDPIEIDVLGNVATPSPTSPTLALTSWIPASVTFLDSMTLEPQGPTLNLDAGRQIAQIWNRSGTRLAVATLTGEVVVMNGTTGTVEARLTGRATRPIGGGWIDDDRFVSVTDGLALVWNLSGTPAITEPLTGGRPWATVVGEGEVAIHADGELILTDLSDSVQDRALSFDQLETCAPMFHQRQLNQLMLACSVPDAEGNPIRHLAFVDVETGQQIGGLVEREENIGANALALSPDGRLVAGSGVGQFVGRPTGGYVLAWDAKTGELVHPLTWLDDWAMIALAWTSSGDFLLAGGQAGNLLYLNPDTWDVDHSVGLTPDSAITSIVLSTDGSLAYVATELGEIWTIDINSRRPLGQPLTGATGQFQSIAVSPDGSRLAVTSRDGALRIWDAESGQLIGPKLEGGLVFALDFVDNDTLLTMGQDETLLWNLATDDLVASACQLAGRVLSDDERERFSLQTRREVTCKPQ